MSEKKWTEGNWGPIEYDNADDRGGGQWYMAGPARVWFPYGSTPDEHARARADAQLIAAAPALFEALEAMIEHAEAWSDHLLRLSGSVRTTGHQGVIDDIAAARAALSLAKGGGS